MVSKRYFKTRDEVELTFEVDADGVESAAVAIETHGWEPQPMRRAKRGKGPFRLKLRVPKDHPLQFRYVLDGARWENDEAADDYWPNGLGSDNSVVFTS